MLLNNNNQSKPSILGGLTSKNNDMKDGKLEVGDKVYYANRNNYHSTVRYTFETVERLTATQAVLTNGAKLKNQECKDWSGTLSFIEIGSRDYWHLTTEKVLEDARKEATRQKIDNWFFKQKFTDEQKQQIYNLFNTDTAK